MSRNSKAKRGLAVLRRLLAHRAVSIGASITLIVMLLAAFGPLLSKKDPLAFDLIQILVPPGPNAPFGTDDLGRDVFSRVMHGTRLSLAVGALVLLSTSVLGTVLGLLSGFYRRIDGVIMRLTDAMMAFPTILLALMIAAVLGPRTQNVVLALTLVYVPRVTRLVRGTVLSIRDRDYVSGGIAIGASDGRLLRLYVLPNVVAPLIVQATYIYGYAVLGEASLSFLGVGTPPPIPSLGNILNDARTMLREAPWVALFPGMAIATTIFGFNLLGDGIRDVLDPQTSKR